jgi:hypothetical protein
MALKRGAPIGEEARYRQEVRGITRRLSAARVDHTRRNS